MPPSAVATGALECGGGACEAGALNRALESASYCQFDSYAADALRLLLQRAVGRWRPLFPGKSISRSKSAFATDLACPAVSDRVHFSYRPLYDRVDCLCDAELRSAPAGGGKRLSAFVRAIHRY
jgi:hypothetical protein